jgi:hypothetical protein
VNRYAIALGKIDPRVVPPKYLPIDRLIHNITSTGTGYFNLTKYEPIRMGTKRCLYCQNPAVRHGGHVLTEDGEIILAGWCREHRKSESPNLFNRVGCFGRWLPEYGMKDTSIF